MPELAEVEFFRKRWHQAAVGQTVTDVSIHERARVFVNQRAALAVRKALPGRTLLGSEAAAKQMCFRFSDDLWLGVHLGMSGELRVEPAGYVPQKHDHMVLHTAGHALVFTDPRMFGGVELHCGPEAPAWWARIAPSLLSPAFTVEAVAAFLRRRARAPIKAVLLMQERFPGIGNWMADEILWRAAIHPRQPAGSLRAAEVRVLWRECRRVCRLALATIAGRGDYLPTSLNAHIPASWLFLHRWTDGGRCPKTRRPLCRETVGGRTSCWSPARQKLHR
ncbi:MAG: Fpg/Nei family DNA glycosylase [Opitutae bacterium]|nr:Fpg/Nei family DNA glycosylase [Opitutae bacterium]